MVTVYDEGVFKVYVYSPRGSTNRLTSTSSPKAKAARENGLKGGRPRSSTKRSTSSKRASGE